MKHILFLSLGLLSVACVHPSASISPSPVALAPALVGSWVVDGGGVRSSGFYDPETLEFADSKPGQYITLTADGQFESGRVTRTGVGACPVTRYEYHRGTVEVRDSVLVLYATAGRVRNDAPCDLKADYEKNDTGVESFAFRPGTSDNSLIIASASLVREMPSVVAAR